MALFKITFEVFRLVGETNNTYQSPIPRRLYDMANKTNMVNATEISTGDGNVGAVFQWGNLVIKLGTSFVCDHMAMDRLSATIIIICVAALALRHPPPGTTIGNDLASLAKLGMIIALAALLITYSANA